MGADDSGSDDDYYDDGDGDACDSDDFGVDDCDDSDGDGDFIDDEIADKVSVVDVIQPIASAVQANLKKSPAVTGTHGQSSPVIINHHQPSSSIDHRQSSSPVISNTPPKVVFKKKLPEPIVKIADHACSTSTHTCVD